MTTPPSIRRFERLFLLSLVLWGVGQIGALSVNIADFERTPDGRGYGWAVVFIVALTLLISLVTWFLVTRRASMAGKWLATGTAAVSAIRMVAVVIDVLRPTGPALPYKLLALAASALTIASVVPLFRDDARAWFGEDLHDDPRHDDDDDATKEFA